MDSVETSGLRQSLTDAIGFWEPRRSIYNCVLALIVVGYFAVNYPASLRILSMNFALGLFVLAVLANVAYCAAYLVDIFAQMSAYRELWKGLRWILFLVGLAFAAILTRFFSVVFFSAASQMVD